MNFYRNAPPSIHRPPSEPGSILPPTGEGELPEFNLHSIARLLRLGLKKQCPNCGRAPLFQTYFRMRTTCPVCGVRFEREAGEYIMAMYINLILTEAIFITGYLLTDHYFNFPVWLQLSIWIPVNGLFPVIFYPFSKSLWAGVLHLMGNLYRDA